MFNINGHGQPYGDMPYQMGQSDMQQQLQAGPSQQQQQQPQPPGRPQDAIDMMLRAGAATAGASGPAGSADFAGFPPWFPSQDGGAARQPMAPMGMSAASDPPQIFSAVVGNNNNNNGSSSSNAEASGSKKKKRRADGESPTVEEKRTKTGRACDACRSKKIRCDILAAEAAGGSAQQICAHCKQYNIECTFFLPITETRFRKRRQAAEEAASPATAKTENGSAQVANGDARPPGAGPTSIPFLLHNAIPTRSFEQYDIANHAHWEVSEDETGQIRVEANHDSGDSDGTRAARLDKYVLPGNVMSQLVNKYFDTQLKWLPIISRAEFLASSTPHPLVLYAICAVASTSRDVPRHVFNRLRGLINGLLRSNEILSHARLEHVQALLLISETGELHAQPAAPTASAALMRTTAAIRMAQDLGLHREPKTKPQTPAELMLIEAKRRTWAACVFTDRWYSCALGIPQMIDVLDCDVLLPSTRNIVPGVDPKEWTENPSYACLNVNLQLSLLTGRILKMIYAPSGLSHTTDEQIETLNKELNAFHKDLRDDFKFHGPDTNLFGGMVHLQYCASLFLFYRGFMRVTHPPPAHIKFTIDPASWHNLVQWSREAIVWLNAHDTLLDTFFIFPYSATSAALVQYHTWSRKRDPSALETLKLVRDVVQRWEAALKPDQMSIRRKTCETMILLYEAALKTNPDADDRTERSEGTPVSAAGSTGSKTDNPALRRVLLNNIPMEGDGTQNAEYSHAPDTNASVAVFDEQGEFDISFLDSIPESNFDWSGWGNYFDTVDKMFPGAACGEAAEDK